MAAPSGVRGAGKCSVKTPLLARKGVGLPKRQIAIRLKHPVAHTEPQASEFLPLPMLPVAHRALCPSKKSASLMVVARLKVLLQAFPF